MNDTAKAPAARESDEHDDFQSGKELCPLCSGRLTVASREFEPSDVLALWEGWGKVFPQEVIDAFASYKRTVLYRCDRCGFGLFRPSWVASATFYDALQADSDTYYLQEKWEYLWALSRVRASDRVLDVGCGAGCFLDLATSRGATCVGIETAPSARRQAISRGFVVHDADIEEASAPVGGEFDVVCAFQVLEHVPDPVGFTRALGSFARPGGSLVIAVPNAEGALRWQKDLPSDLPPHHLSRWSLSSVEALASRVGLEVIDTAYEPLDIVHHWVFLLGWWKDFVMRGRGADDRVYTPAGFAQKAGHRTLRAAQKVALRAGLNTLPWIRGHTVAVSLRKPQHSPTFRTSLQ